MLPGLPARFGFSPESLLPALPALPLHHSCRPATPRGRPAQDFPPSCSIIRTSFVRSAFGGLVLTPYQDGAIRKGRRIAPPLPKNRRRIGYLLAVCERINQGGPSRHRVYEPAGSTCSWIPTSRRKPTAIPRVTLCRGPLESLRHPVPSFPVLLRGQTKEHDGRGGTRKRKRMAVLPRSQ